MERKTKERRMEKWKVEGEALSKERREELIRVKGGKISGKRVPNREKRRRTRLELLLNLSPSQ